MADISSIKLPNGTTYTLKDSGALQLTGGAVTGPVSFGDSVSIDEATIGNLVVNGSGSFTNGVKASNYNGGQPTYTVIGTQTAATGSWTGNIDAPALYDGMRILYYLPYAGSGNATLNLTLSNGTTTGAVNCYYNTGRLTTHYGAGQNFHMTYWSAGSIKINGTAITDNRWIVDAQYYSNTVSQLRHDYSVVYAGSAGIFPYTLIMMNKDGNYESIVTSSSTGTSKAKNTAGFLPGRLLLYYASGTTTNGNKITASNYGLYEGYTGFDARYSFNISTTGLTVGKPIYLVGTISNGLFYLADTWWTQTLPTSADGKVYMYVGQVYMPASTTSDYRVNIVPYHPIYQYTNGALRLYGGDAATINGLTVQTAVPSNAKFTDENVKSTSITGSVDTLYLVGSSSASTTTSGLNKHNNARIKFSPDYTVLSLGTNTSDLSNSGQISLYRSLYHVDLHSDALTANRSIALPDKTGTVALTSDISSYTATSPIDITDDDISHEDSGVTAGTYDGGYSKNYFYIPTFTVDSKGHITNASEISKYLTTISPSNSIGLMSTTLYNYGLKAPNNWYKSSTYSYCPRFLLAGQTSATWTISDPTSTTSILGVYDIIARDYTTGEKLVVDWSSGISSNQNILTVSIATAYPNDIMIIPIFSGVTNGH